MEWDRDIGYTVSGRLGVICRAGQGSKDRAGQSKDGAEPRPGSRGQSRVTYEEEGNETI
jgi:hypothetical protein